MLSKEANTYFKDNGYTFEEIEGIKKGLKESNIGETLTQADMEKFVKEELFSKYTTNV